MNYLLVFEIMGKRYAEFKISKQTAKNKVTEFRDLAHWTLYDDSLKICDSSGEHLDYRGAILN